LCQSAGQSGGIIRVALGEFAHRGRFIYRNSDQISAQKDALQMSGAVTDLEHARPVYEGDYFLNPVFPFTKRNYRRNNIVSECKLVVKEVEENTEQGTHWF
jgi:hypothetical protein